MNQTTALDLAPGFSDAIQPYWDDPDEADFFKDDADSTTDPQRDGSHK